MKTTTTQSSNGTSTPLSQCTLQTCDLSRSYFDHPPLTGSAEAYLIYFGIFLIMQTILGLWHRTWSFLIGVSSFLLLFILGYVATMELHNDPFSAKWFELYMIAFTVAPTFMVLVLHLCVEKILTISSSGPLPILPSPFVRVTLGIELVGLIFQIAGSAAFATSTSPAGRGLAVFGLSVQTLTLAVDTIVCVVIGVSVCSAVRPFPLHVASTKAAQEGKGVQQTELLSKSKKFTFFVIGIAMSLASTLARTVLQIMIISGGREGQQLRKQSLYQGAGTSMAVAVLLLSCCHPGFMLSGRSNVTARGDVGQQSSAKENRHLQSQTSMAEV